MPRWKQRFVCVECAHSAWREVITDALEPPPNARTLEARGFYCSACGARKYRVFQVALLAGRWNDAFQPGGMRLGAMNFRGSAVRDVELQKARETSRAQPRGLARPGLDESGNAY